MFIPSVMQSISYEHHLIFINEQYYMMTRMFLELNYMLYS